MTKTNNTQTQTSKTPAITTETTALCADLRATLSAPDDTVNARTLLLRQAQILDSMLHTLVTRELNKGFSRGYCEEQSLAWTSLALRAQKQCADTLRTIGTMDYMQALVQIQAKDTQATPAPTRFANELKETQ